MVVFMILFGENWVLRLVIVVKILFVVVFEVIVYILVFLVFLGYFCYEMSWLEFRKYSLVKVFVEFILMGENEGVNLEKMDLKFEGVFDNRWEI